MNNNNTLNAVAIALTLMAGLTSSTAQALTFETLNNTDGNIKVSAQKDNSMLTSQTSPGITGYISADWCPVTIKIRKVSGTGTGKKASFNFTECTRPVKMQIYDVPGDTGAFRVNYQQE